MLHPRTARACLIPRCSVTSVCWALTLSKKVTFGKGLIFEFDGEVDWPLPKRAVMMIKYFFGLRVWFSPTSHSLSAIAVTHQSRFRSWGEPITSRVPCRIYNCWWMWIPKCFVGNFSIGDWLSGLKLPVTKFIRLNACHCDDWEMGLVIGKSTGAGLPLYSELLRFLRPICASYRATVGAVNCLRIKRLNLILRGLSVGLLKWIRREMETENRTKSKTYFPAHPASILNPVSFPH